MATSDKDNETKAKNTVENLSRLLDAQQREDYWLNTSTGIGTAYDRHRNMTQAKAQQITDQELEAYYIDNDIAATVVDRVPEEAMRQGYTVNFDGIEPGQAEAIVKWGESTYNILQHILQARKWARLFGGGAVFMAADNGQELVEPLEPGYDVKYLRPFSRTDLETALWYDDDEDVLTEKFGMPSVYTTTMRTGSAHYRADIHESRFHVFPGVLTTQVRFQENKGWGDSVLTRVIDVLKRFDGSWISVMALLIDSSVPIYKLKDLMSLLESGQLDALIARFRLIDAQKNNMRAVLLDADGESYERVPAEMTDMSSVLQNTMIRMSAAAKLPVSILFGQAPAGLNASPEGDLRNFYDRVDVERKEAVGPSLLHIYTMLLAQKGSPTGGKVPEDLTINFPSLWQTDPVQGATLYQMRATADGIYIANQVVSPEEVAIARSATAEPFGFPTIDIETRKEILEMLNNPEGLVSGEGLPGSVNMPSNAVMPRGKGSEETGAPATLSVSTEPQKASLTGAQIKMLEELAEKVAQGAIPKSTAEAIVAGSYPMEPEAIKAIFADIDDLYSVSSAEERAELRALPFGGVKPGSDGQVGPDAPVEEEEDDVPEGAPEGGDAPTPPSFAKGKPGAEEAEEEAEEEEEED